MEHTIANQIYRYRYRSLCKRRRIYKKDGVGINGSYSGTSGNMPIELPSGIGVDDIASINWSLSYEKGFANWRQIGKGVISLATIFQL